MTCAGDGCHGLPVCHLFARQWNNPAICRIIVDVTGFYRFLADVVSLVHFAYVAFVVLGLLLILTGIALRWKWVRNFWFRTVHLLMIGVVAAESICGIECPLTTWEYDLRIAAGQEWTPDSFIGRMVHALMFLNPPEWGFAVCYCLFGLAVLATFILAPPRRPKFAARTSHRGP
jgi:hypothetical protein